jgi:hypothetical protein
MSGQATNGHVDARLVGPLSIDRYLERGEDLPGGGALNMAYHWARRDLRCEMISRVAADGAELFGAFLDRNDIGHTPDLVQVGAACTVDIRFADDRQPMMDNFVEGILGDFRLTDAEAERLVSGVPAHLVLVDVIDDELHRLAGERPLDGARLTGDFLSFRHFTPERFSASMQWLDVGFIGWPGSMISSPVEMIATRGRRQTSTDAAPIAASVPVSRLVSVSPRRRTVSPAEMSVPAKLTPKPGVTALRTTNSLSSISVFSTITTASAPRGTMPPVAMVTAVPAPISIVGTTAVAKTSSSSFKRRGSSSVAP